MAKLGLNQKLAVKKDLEIGKSASSNSTRAPLKTAMVKNKQKQLNKVQTRVSLTPA